MIDFQAPVTAGTVLVRSAIQSPNYVHGTSGWSVNQDGSAELNNLTLRGTFVGTTYVQNSAGDFYYSGTPGAGNLIASIAATSGNDGFGNPYNQGVSVYAPGQTFATMFQGQVFIGDENGSFPDLTDAGAWFTANGSRMTALQSKKVPSTFPDAVQLRMLSGVSGSTSGSANAPHGGVVATDGTTPADWYVSGTVIQTDVTGTPLTWQTPAYNTGWSAATTFNGQTGQQTLQLRKTGGDAVRLDGCAAAVTGAGGVPLVLPTGYRPLLAQMVPAIQYDPTSAKVITGFARIDSNGNVTFSTAEGFASIVNGTQIWISGDFPLGNIP